MEKEGKGIWLQFSEGVDGCAFTPGGPHSHFPVISTLQDMLFHVTVSGEHIVLEQLHFIPLFMHNL